MLKNGRQQNNYMSLLIWTVAFFNWTQNFLEPELFFCILISFLLLARLLLLTLGTNGVL